MLHGPGRLTEMEVKGNHAPRGEWCPSGDKCEGMIGREAKKERALVMNEVWGRWVDGARSGPCWC